MNGQLALFEDYTQPCSPESKPYVGPVHKIIMQAAGREYYITCTDRESIARQLAAQFEERSGKKHFVRTIMVGQHG